MAAEESSTDARMMLNAVEVELPASAVEQSLLATLREHFGLRSLKDGCSPQGQCGCCTVWVDGEPRVACVTATTRVVGRSVTTIEGLDPALSHALAQSFAACGASQCGFCTPGIAMRLAPLVGGHPDAIAIERALSAHICRCTGWQTIVDAFDRADRIAAGEPAAREACIVAENNAEAQAALEWGVEQPRDTRSVTGELVFSEDDAPEDALVAVVCAPEVSGALRGAGYSWIVADTLAAARLLAGHVQGRKTTLEPVPPLPLPTKGSVRLTTSWVDAGYLEPDASWCVPGGTPSSPRRYGGAFGGKANSPLPRAAEELAATLGAPVRAVWSREDVTRYSVKRPPIGASADLEDSVLIVRGFVAAPAAAAFAQVSSRIVPPYDLKLDVQWADQPLNGPPISPAVRAAGLAELWVLVEAALEDAGIDRAGLIRDPVAASVLLDTCAPGLSGAFAGARVELSESGELESVEVRVAAGRPFDSIMLRSYCIGSVHAALGWTLSESISVDAQTGVVNTLTIRGLGQLRPKDMPPVAVTIVEDDRAPLAASDAVFAAVAAATWNAVAAHSGMRPTSFPMRECAAGRVLRR